MSAGPSDEALRIPLAEITLDADVVRPMPARGVVLFAHGSGSGRHSPRNAYVAGVLNRAGLTTVLVDLLSPEEEQLDLASAELRFDIDLLADRVIRLVDWLQHESGSPAPVGLFGASTGAGAALVAAAARPGAVGAVVSRGGRPDLAAAHLVGVAAPTLLIVGGDDTRVVELNRGALEQLRVDKRLEIIKGATHLFEEPGALERVGELARDWFLEHLDTTSSSTGAH